MLARGQCVLVTALAWLLAASAVAVPAPVSAATFTDIGTSIFKADIEWLAAEGITTGCSEALYCPTGVVTREQMASFLVRMFKLPATATDPFTDDETSVHEPDINRLAASGITTGCTATTFCPRQQVTRAQMASFIARAAKLTAGSGNDYFYDDDGMAAEPDIDRAAAAGIVTGCWDFRYCATWPVTREQMAGFLHRVVQPVASPPRIGWPVTGIYGYKWSGPPYVLEVRSTGSVGPNQPDYVLEIRIIEESTERLVGFKAFTFAEAYDATSRLSVPVNAGLHTVQYTDRYSDEFGVLHGLTTMEVNVGVHPTAQEIRASADR